MSTVISRLKLTHPDLGAAGGAGLHTEITTLFNKIGDNTNARYFSTDALANAASVDYDHNFKCAFDDLRFDLYSRNIGSGELTELTELTTPLLSQFTIVATPGFLTTKIRVTNNSGAARDISFVVLQDPINLNELADVDLTIAAEDGQALVYDLAATQWKAGASGDASFKISSVTTPNAVLKGGFLLVDNGKELATYDGSGALSTDFGKDITVSLTTILGSAPANATAYYLYIDLTTLAASVTLTDNGRKVYAVVQSNFALSTVAPDVIDLARYIPRAVIKSATTGTAWSGAGSSFATLAFLAAQTVDGSLKTFVRPQVTQTAHGFTSSNLGAPLYLTAGGVYTLAKADAANTAEVVALLYSIPDVNTLILAVDGRVTINTAVSGGALVVGSTYFVSPVTAGLITATEPSVIGQVSKPIGTAISTTVLEFINMRGVTVGGANALTTISIATNSATNTIQNVSAYQAGELTGYVSVAGTASQKFYIAAQFSKNAAGTDYNLSYQTSGETPVSGFSMTVTAAGLIQITLPAVAGFTAASITYGLNVPAIGVTLPLSISARGVLGDTTGTAVPAGYIGETITITRPTNTGILAVTTPTVIQSLGTLTAGTYSVDWDWYSYSTAAAVLAQTTLRETVGGALVYRQAFTSASNITQSHFRYTFTVTASKAYEICAHTSSGGDLQIIGHNVNVSGTSFASHVYQITRIA